MGSGVATGSGRTVPEVLQQGGHVLRLALVMALVSGCASQSPRAPYAVPDAVTAPEPISSTPFQVLSTWFWADTLTSATGGSELAATTPGMRFGLFDASRFRLATGDCTDCALPDAVLWHFEDEVIAVPRDGQPRIRFNADTRAVNGAASEATDTLPAVIWLGAGDRVAGARLRDSAGTIQFGNEQQPLRVAPRLPANRSFIDATTARYLADRPLTVRGALRDVDPEGVATGPVFVARTFWPADWRLDVAALAPAPLRASETLGTLIEARDSAASGPLPIRLLWEREPEQGGQGEVRDWSGRAVLAFILSGAQGDDDGSRGGHLGIATGRVGPDGEWDQWLVENFYPVDEPNAKGIVPASVPADKYLTDVNSGQLFYRPGYMLVAVLREPRVAVQVQQALHGTLMQLYCREITYYRGRNNSTAMSVDPLRELGWRIPTVGASSRILGWMMAPVTAIAARSLSMGRELAGALSTERSRMLPRVAFEVAGHDLLALIATATAGESDDAPLTPFEQMLADDVEALAFVRLPQIPSSRRFGTHPEQSMLTFAANVFARPGPFQFAPEAPERAFSAELEGSCVSQ
jgi:hypothetical protein